MKNMKKKNILGRNAGTYSKIPGYQSVITNNNQFYLYGLQCDVSYVKYGTNLIKTFDKYDKYHIFHFVGVPGSYI